MSNFIISILVALLMIAVALFATTLVVAGFIGVGVLFARFTELTLFQATIVTVPVGLGVFYLFRQILQLPGTADEDEWDEWDEWEDWDADLDFEDLPAEARRRLIRRLKEFVEELEELEAQDDVEVEARPRRQRRRR